MNLMGAGGAREVSSEDRSPPCSMTRTVPPPEKRVRTDTMGPGQRPRLQLADILLHDQVISHPRSILRPDLRGIL
jgi:hypothetical protein